MRCIGDLRDCETRGSRRLPAKAVRRVRSESVWSERRTSANARPLPATRHRSARLRRQAAPGMPTPSARSSTGRSLRRLREAAMTNERVDIVILTHNRKREVLRTIARMTAVDNVGAVIAVDNGSAAVTADAVAAEFSHVPIIRL